MVRGTIDNLLKWMACDHIGVVDEDAPEVDRNKERKVEMSLQREKAAEKVIWN